MFFKSLNSCTGPKFPMSHNWTQKFGQNVTKQTREIIGMQRTVLSLQEDVAWYHSLFHMPLASNTSLLISFPASWSPSWPPDAPRAPDSPERCPLPGRSWSPPGSSTRPTPSAWCPRCGSSPGTATGCCRRRSRRSSTAPGATPTSSRSTSRRLPGWGPVWRTCRGSSRWEGGGG